MTTDKPMRTYGDSCGIARALDLVGERWALLVLRELLLGPKRFTDLRSALPGVSPDVLAQRLRELESAGVLARRRLAPPAAARVYELTEWGSELEPVLVALGRWGSRAALPDDPPQLSPDALAVALESMFDQGGAGPLESGGGTGPREGAHPGAAGPVEGDYRLELGEHVFTVSVAGGTIKVRRPDSAGPAPRLTIITDPGTLTAALWHGLDVDQAIRSGALTIDGPRSELARFLKLFAQPVPVPAPALQGQG
jgi:DNA-binding HxlR family transcriptional regulator